jgi:hypothetical protein
VLQQTGGTADAEICGTNFCLQFETKIKSASLRKEQIRAHLKTLEKRPGKMKRLILLTPDDTSSKYIQDCLDIDPTRILHLSWKHAYDSIATSVQKYRKGPLKRLGQMFLEQIHEMVFKQDRAGIILKIHFGNDSNTYPKTYLKALKKEQRWNTPKPYTGLDGTGRKLMLYDKTCHGITAEAEIGKVKRIPRENDFPYDHIFAPNTLHIFKKPIPLSRIRQLSCFNNFGKDRTPFRNITREEYRSLTAS